MSVTFIQRTAAKQPGGNGTITVPLHTSAAAGDLQMLAVSSFASNAPGNPSGTGWTQLYMRSNSYSRLTIFTRTLPAGEVSTSVTVAAFDYTNAEMRSYRVTSGEVFMVNGSGDGFVAASTTVVTWLIRCWASAQVNSFGGSTKTLTPPAGLLNAPASTSYNWYDGGLFGDDPVTSGTSGTSTATQTGGTETISPQWANLMLTMPDVTGVSVTNLTAVPVNGGANVSWDVTPQATGYDYRVNGGTVSSVATNSVTLSGLTNGTSYLVEVRPTTSTTTGNWASVSVTPSSVFLTDDFNRADSTTTLGSPVTGGPYTVRVGTWGISSNQAYTPTATTEAHVTFPGLVDSDVQATFTVVANSMGLIVRWVDASNYWLFTTASSNVYAIYRRTAGTLTSAVTTSQAAVNGDVVRGIAKGRYLYLLVNGRMIASVEDHFFSAATGTCGMKINANNTGRIDSLSGAASPTLIPGGVDGGTGMSPSIDFGINTASPMPSFVYRGRDTKSADDGNP